MSLNNKLWEWLGVKEQGDFTNDLNLCFKWLVPKIEHYSLWHGAPRIINQPPMGEHNAEVWIGHNYGYGHSKETSALALCLAIEKLIKEN